MTRENMQLRKNHRFLAYATSIKQICKPLSHLQIHMFTYRKRFNDGSEIYLSTHPNWIEDYFKLQLYQSSIFEGDISCYPTGFLTWPKQSNLEVFKHGQVYYNSFSGITFCKNNTDSCELFFFSSERPNHFSDYYLYNLDLFMKFVTYFKEKSAEIVKDCLSYRITPPSFVLHPDVGVYVNRISQNTNLSQRDAFTNAIESEKCTYRKSQLSILTKREHMCLDLLMREHSIVTIAKILGISHRTAEIHLLNIRNKLECRSKIELLLKIQKMMLDSD